jgi:undecaprenyl phosphate N,N'-diacetylbacillosamine 1-phosphate transferase
MYKSFIKPFFDFLIAFTGLVIISPVFLFVYILLKINNKGTAFFVQKRPGKNEKIFSIIKFKTMTDEKDANGYLLQDSQRLTKVGKFVRKTSLDELPQLFNILKGEMSLIGPRPLMPEYLPYYDETQKRRHLVRPGITGLAQVKGRNHMKFSERLVNDVYYVDNLSFGLDVRILFITIKSVLFKSQDIVLGQTVDEVDDIGLGRSLDKNHFKNAKT